MQHVWEDDRWLGDLMEKNTTWKTLKTLVNERIRLKCVFRKLDGGTVWVRPAQDRDRIGTGDGLL